MQIKKAKSSTSFIAFQAENQKSIAFEKKLLNIHLNSNYVENKQ